MIIHFTTVHPRTDTRIRVKEVATLARHWPGQVELYVQDGLGDEEDAQDGFQIHDTGPKPKGRLRRMTLGAFRMYRAIRRARPRIAHFHDPELLPWAVLLRLSGIMVIYDVHEDLPAAVLSKPYIPTWLRRPLSLFVRVIEGSAARFMTANVPATPSIALNFDKSRPEMVQNYPLLAELQGDEAMRGDDLPPHFAYVGGITRIRSAAEMVAALELVHDSNVRLQMMGTANAQLLEKLENISGWQRVVSHGWADRPTVSTILSRCRAGLVLYYPEPNHVRAQPNKMFEYMAAGVPVIASNFPLWRQIVEGAGCGLLVDPQDPQAIANAMQWILDNPDEADAMGRRGRVAVEERFNWEAESEKLVALYRRLMTHT
ncbi:MULTISPECIES: glycosyltransferase [unclassified Yoonia]|uniref:glycosyltransferase n=1 Tax=unclassified Yoonia TaxID=2629118 RepID=UPI002AFE263B|nr:MULTISPECIES: glycosyltransferase [unclassified Yoonia]